MTSTQFRFAAGAAILVGVIPVAAQVNVQQQSSGFYYTGVHVSGSYSSKYDVVFVGDGFTAADQPTFNARVADAVAALQARDPYSTTMCALNIWRVNVVSTDSGVDHPKDNIFRNTELDCRYGNPPGEAERCIRSDSPAKCYEAAAWAPDDDAVFVLVNDTAWGGCAGNLVFSSISPGFAGIITHELGHKIGGLADEYTCYVCDGSDNNRAYPGGEPGDVNLTTQTNRALIKWNSLILPTTPIPTTVDNPVGVVGLWAGGGYYGTGIYRPQSTCHMRATGSDFCAVCRQEMRSKLASYCTACELDPSSLKCRFGDLLSRFQYELLDPTRIRWPIPPCLSCPFKADLLQAFTQVQIDGLPAGYSLRVLDDAGAVVAETDGISSGGEPFGIGWDAFGDTQYFAELVPTEAFKPSNSVATLSIQLLRDGVEQELPGGQ